VDLAVKRQPSLKPELNAEIEYRAKSAEGKVHHPFFKGLREDL
jgi:bifunctional non-homologous end joining protein LigD